MKYLSAILAIAAAVTGLLASYYWLQSSKVVIDPAWQIEPGDPQLAQMGWITAILNALSDAAGLNARAAMLTAASVFLAAAATLVSVIF